MKLSIRTDIAQVTRWLGGLPADLRDKAAARALNRAVETGRTRMRRAIAAEFNLTQSFVNERLGIRRASAAGGNLRLEASLAAKGRRSFNVLRFLERSVTPAPRGGQRKAGTLNRLFVQIRRGGGRKALPPGAFVQTAQGGTAVFRRVGKARLPIEPVNTIAVPQMFNAKRVNAVVRQAIRETFVARFKHEAALLLRQRG